MARHYLGFGSVMLSLVLAAPAYAQTQAQADAQAAGGGLEEIVVTAQKRAENMQRVPIAVTAISGSVLLAGGVEAAISLPRLTPGLAVNSSGAFSSPYIRGIGTQYASLGLESSVATYYNGVYLSRPVSGLVSFNDVERIEVLKGPQGTLYGRNSAAGAIQIVTRDPVQKFEGNVALVGGNYGLYGAEGVLNAPLSNDVAIRVAGRIRHRDSYVKAAYVDQTKIGDNQESLVTAKLLWDPGERLKVKLSFDYEYLRDTDQVAFSNLNSDVPEQAGLARGGRGRTGFYTASQNTNYSDIYSNRQPTEFIKTYGAELRVDYDMDAFTMSSISGFRSSDLFDWADIDATDAPLQQLFFQEQSKLYSQEFQAVSSGAGPFKWVAGVYYMQERGSNQFDLFGQSVNDIFGEPYGPNIGSMDGNPALSLRARVNVESFAPYAQASYDLMDGLTLTAGLRYTSESKTLVDNDAVVTGLGPDFSIFHEAGIKYKFHKFTPRVTLSYDASKNLLLYATYSQGFKSGGVGTPTSSAQSRILPEDLKAYEVGFKLNGRKARLNGSFFYYDYTNLQVQVRDPITGANFVRNAATAEVYGSELEGLVVPADGLQLGAGVSYLHARYTNYIGVGYTSAHGSAACADAGGGDSAPYPIACQGNVTFPADFSGASLTNAPEWSGHFRATYTHDLGDAGEVVLNGLVSYQGDYNHVAGGLTEPGKALLSGAITWNSSNEHYSVTLAGDNLTAKKYYSYRTESANARYGVVGAPRTVTVKVAYHF